MQDIPYHLDRVLSYLANEDEIDRQKLRMEEAVYSGTAYKLVDEDDNTLVFFYYEQRSEQEIDSIAIQLYSKRLFAITAVWFRRHTYNRYIYIMPHEVEQLNHFEFLATDESIRYHHVYNTPLIVDLFSQKLERLRELYDKMKVEEL